MEGSAVLLIQVESWVEEGDDGSAPYVQFCAWGEGWVRCEVSGNEYLASRHLLDPIAVETLTGLGWSEPTCERGEDDTRAGSANFYLDLERSHADRLAVMTVTALRDVFGVADPAFLSAEDMAEDPEAAPGVGGSSSQPSSADPDEPVAVFPRDRKHLRSLVDDALTPFLGQRPEHDEDGDIPVVSGGAVVFVTVTDGVPAISLFTPVVCDVAEPGRVRFEVAVLNRDLRFIKFLATDDQVTAHLHLPAWPFAPEQLRMMLAVMLEKVDEIGDDLAARLGGRRAFEPASEDCDTEEVDQVDDEDLAEETQLHPAIMTLHQLDAESPGSVDPELAASICGMDRDVILDCITWHSEQEIAWRLARDEAVVAGDRDEEADVCDDEMQHAERTATLLRRALRFVVERELGRHPGVATQARPVGADHGSGADRNGERMSRIGPVVEGSHVAGAREELGEGLA